MIYLFNKSPCQLPDFLLFKKYFLFEKMDFLFLLILIFAIVNNKVECLILTGNLAKPDRVKSKLLCLFKKII